MKKIYFVFLFCAGLFNQAFSQTYCAPTFLNGCFTWNNQYIELDSIVWELGITDCAISDYTALSTTLTQDVAMAMTIINGAWCGAGVWIDTNSDGAFDDTENLYHSYQAGDPMTYDIQITVPATVAAGTYRMRVIAGWGTDCFDVTSTNGNGACGSYQYGSYQDFTIHVVAPSAVASVKEDLSVKVLPNPTHGNFQLNIPSSFMNSNYILTNIVGEVVQSGKVTSLNTRLDIENLPNGIYIMKFDNKLRNAVRIVKN